MPHPQPDRFPLATFSHLDPVYLTESDHDLTTATHWTLHLPAANRDEAAITARRLLTAPHFTAGDYCGGDSWEAWAEPATPNQDVAVHVYFVAPDLFTARSQARLMADSVGTMKVALSTAGDWAEQVDPFIL